MTNESMVEALKAIVNHCKGEVCLSINPHRGLYQKAGQYLKDIQDRGGDNDSPLADEDVTKEMIATDTIVHLQFYPRTPIGFYSIYHHDIGAALDEAMEILNELAEDRKEQPS